MVVIQVLSTKMQPATILFIAVNLSAMIRHSTIYFLVAFRMIAIRWDTIPSPAQ